jgi:Phage-related tail fibre protein
MANLKETAKWETGVYQFEESDPVKGGPNGIDNVPTRQLANRTVYLKQEVERAATTKIAGRVKLNSSTDSDSETEAATPKSVKITYDLANEAKNAATKAQNSANKAISTADTAKQTAETTATTKIAGRVKLNSSIDSESETEAATPKAIKMIRESVQDLANDAVSKSGDTMTGQLKTSKYGIKYQFDNDDAMVTKTIGDNYAFVFFNAETDNRASKLVFNTQSNEWRFQYVDDVTINGKSILKSGDAVQFFGDLSDKTNLNELIGNREGIYYQSNNKSALSERGYPVQEAGTLQVFKNGTDDSGCCQIYTTYRNARQFIRNYRGNTQNWDSWIEQITTTNINNYIPVGVPLPWPASKPPDGWFECNGSSFDKKKCPKLAAAYPSGRLIDLRAEFIRGWDNGRGVDPNRKILSWQEDAIRNIYGEISPISETFGAAPTATGVFQYFERHADHTPEHIDVGSVGGVTLDASRVVPVANENRSRNIVFMYIVKAE